MMSVEIDFTTQPVRTVFNIIQKLPRPSPFVFDDVLDRFADFVKSRPLDVSKESLYLQHANSAFQSEFLFSIEESVSKGDKIDWNTTLNLIKCILSDYKPDKHGDSLMYGTYDLLKTGMEKDQIDLKHGAELWNIIQMMVDIGSKHPDTDRHSNTDALTASLNSPDGMSFHALYHYMQWCQKHKLDFKHDAKKIFDEYIDKKLGRHTTSRHAVLGVYLLAFYDHDREWAKQIPDKIASDVGLMAAFWECYVCYNNLHVDAFDDLHKWYIRMFFGETSGYNCSRRACKTTLDHLALAYLHDLKHSEYFKTFLNETKDKDLVDHCIFFVGRLIKGKKDDKSFNKEKLKRMWQQPKFLSRPGLEIWFENSLFDQKTTINLHLAYLRECPKKDFLSDLDVIPLKKYVAKYPIDVAECLKLLVQKSNHVSDDPFEILKLLDQNPDRNIKVICSEIKRHLRSINI